jgi:hypothetical protein
MAHKQVGVRTEGDVYQGLFFWRQAAALLIPEWSVQQVGLEHDAAAGVDDVAVFYDEPGVDAGGWLSPADFYQLKYHVDRRDAYSCDALADPTFINSKSSLLQRFHSAYLKVSAKYPRFRLHLASNWRWRDDDALAAVLREYDGQLPDAFFTSGAGTALGKARESWRSHLSMDKDTFESFGRTLRIQLDHFGRRHFREMVHDRLAAAGLRVPTGPTASSPYESLYQQFLMSGPNSFNRETFRDLCEREGLLADKKAGNGGRMPTLGIRSFLRFAERLEEETDEFVCVASQFEGRHPRSTGSWPHAVASLVDFFADTNRRARIRKGESAIVLECHSTLAALAGYELSRNSGCAVFPVQKPRQELWKPGTGAMATSPLWIQERVPRNAGAQDIAVALSLTHDIVPAVGDYLDTACAGQVHLLLSLKPTTGVGPESVQGAGHAYQLAAALIPILRSARTSPAARVHLFTSAPNALLFLIGQYREALGRITFYEYDFGFERHGTYEPSVSFPLTHTASN